MCENCEKLQARITELENIIQSADESAEENLYYAQQSAHEAELAAAARVREVQRQARQAREEADAAEYERSRQVRELERARSWGDRSGEERALARIKRGW